MPSSAPRVLNSLNTLSQNLDSSVRRVPFVPSQAPRIKLPGMTVDQTINLWAAIGTWCAAAGTVAAATVALLLARRAEKVKLKTWVGYTLVTNSPEEFISFSVTNRGERPVTITELVFRVRHHRKRYQRVGDAVEAVLRSLVGRHPNPKRYRSVGLLWQGLHLPRKIEHGESVSFNVDFTEWVDAMREGVLHDIPEKDWKTLRALIVTSVGHKEVVEVDRHAMERLCPEADSA